MMRPKLALPVLAISTLAATLPAQLRRPCLGTVVDAAGRPLPDATVTLVWTPEARVPGRAEALQAVTDARGRFKADLIVGRAYSAWAIGSKAEDGSHAISELTERAAAGVVLEIAAWREGRPRRLRFSGHGPWIGDRPARLVLFPDGNSEHSIELPPADGNAVELPPTPWCRALVGLLDANGVLVQVCPVEPGDPEPTVAFEAPRKVLLEVVDAAGKPVAGATVEQMLHLSGSRGNAVLRPRGRNRWSPSGSTDERGRIRVLAASIEPGIPGWVRAGAKGMSWSHVPLISASDPDEDGLRRLRVELGPAAAPTASLQGLHEGEIALGQLVTTVRHSQDRVSSALRIGLDLRIEPEGQVHLDRWPGKGLDPSLVWHLLPREEGTPRYVLSTPIAGELQSVPSVSLEALGTWRLRAFDVDNNPLPGAEVLVFPVPDRPRVEEGTHFVLDHAGRGDFLLSQGRWGIYATNGTAHALRLVEGREGGEVRMRLEALPTLRCRVVDAEGRPVRGARIEAKGLGRSGGPLRNMVNQTRDSLGAMVTLPCAEAARSDADGMLVVPIQDWLPMDRPVWVRAGDRVSKAFPLVPAEEVLTLVVE